MIELLRHSTDLREAEAIESLAEQLTRLADASTLWREQGALPLARRLRETGDAGSNGARIDYIAYATLFQIAFGEVRQAIEDAQRALAEDASSAGPGAETGLTLDEANALKQELARRQPGVRAVIQATEAGGFYLLAYLPTPIYSRAEYEAWMTDRGDHYATI